MAGFSVFFLCVDASFILIRTKRLLFFKRKRLRVADGVNFEGLYGDTEILVISSSFYRFIFGIFPLSVNLSASVDNF